ncbi:hypothetical protein V1477_018818 [Vespula maculifrons]|uniref:Uncharacterized protein n=1 Tax=Vespula maculifrons TaxID=7453 RepID=A0ABD2AXB9_VESMC
MSVFHNCPQISCTDRKIHNSSCSIKSNKVNSRALTTNINIKTKKIEETTRCVAFHLLQDPPSGVRNKV